MLKFLRRLDFWLHHRRLEADFAEELDLHRTLTQEHLEQNGMSRADAERASRRRLGNVTLSREDARHVWLAPWIESVWQDAAYSLRIMRRSPGFAVAMILVMALGIGTTTGVFGLIDGLVLKNLPVRDPDRLAYLSRPAFSYTVFAELKARGQHIFSELFAWNLEGVHVQWGAELERTEVLLASGEFYRALGVGPALGRTFSEEDDRIGGGRDGLVAVISYASWSQRFNADPSVIGRTVRIERRPFTIIGVTPPGFFGVAPGLAPEITIPLTAIMDQDTLRSNSTTSLHLMGRLRDGLTIESGNAALQNIWQTVLEVTTRPDMPADRKAMYLSRTTALESGRAGFSRVRNQFEEPLWLLLALVGLLLTIATASAANLWLARGVARRREFSLRLAIGAGRWRVVRQMLTEAFVWSILGASAGLFVASWGANALVVMMRTREEPIVLEVHPNGRVLLFTLALALVTAVMSAVLPAFRATRLNAGAMLKEFTQIGGSSRTRGSVAGRMLVTAQVALTVLLLFGAGLFVRSLQRILAQDAGFERNILVVSNDAVAAGYSDERLAVYHAALLERLQAIPGVESASLSGYPPISDEDGAWTQSVSVDGAPIVQDQTRYVYFNGITPGYFRTLGIRVLYGRDFSDSDRPSSKRVVIVTESLVRRFFPDINPIGRLITIGRDERRRDLEIIGVVSDAKYQRLQEPTRRIAYLPVAQLPRSVWGSNLVAELRVAGPVSSVADNVRREIRAVDSTVPIRIQTVNERIRESLVTERVIAVLATTVGLTAMALACAALYGLLAYTVSQQTSEIGLRMALGADRATVLWMVLRQSLVLGAAGVAAGLAASIALGRLARNVLYEVSATDPLALAAAGGLMLFIALCAGFLPARRAALVDPVVAIKSV